MKDEIKEPVDLVKTQCTDAREWARQFIDTVNVQGWTLEDIDEGLMLAWFASAIETTKDSIHNKGK